MLFTKFKTRYLLQHANTNYNHNYRKLKIRALPCLKVGLSKFVFSKNC